MVIMNTKEATAYFCMYFCYSKKLHGFRLGVYMQVYFIFFLLLNVKPILKFFDPCNFVVSILANSYKLCARYAKKPGPPSCS